MKEVILIGGDFCPNNSKYSLEKNHNLVWNDASYLFDKCDLSIVNLECPLHNDSNVIEKTGPTLSAGKNTIEYLAKVNVDVLTLANNHIMDHGIKSLKKTQDLCFKYRIDTVGAGLTLEEAKETLYKKINNTVIAIVNFTENEWSVASREKGGANYIDLIENAEQIKTAKEKSDFVLVIIHGGHEGSYYPSPRMVKQYRFFADCGASAIVCHHSHCVSGFEDYNGVPIFYGIGNLLFPYNTKSPEWYIGMFVELTINGDSLSWDVIPFRQYSDKFGLELLKREDSISFFQKIDGINSIILNPEMLEDKWEEFVLSRQERYLSLACIPSTLLSRVLYKLKISRYFRSRKHMRMLLNLVRCESHNDILL
jgi:poly-gamma-glutamate synthesis protein (capsule biosynthesis protein)